MAESSWLMVAAGLSLAGMAWLALGMDVHWSQVMHRPADEAVRTRRALRALGAAALLLSLLACLRADRPSMAVLVWVMLLAGSAVAVALALARRPALLALAWPPGRQRGAVAGPHG
ncbi:DUF3325 family protein [Azohydromonas aeria]|uniref:DUF3325 family protein n=1 Tax=Azohydromonas aeria TaxID=2590212 RepID=UPI0012F9521D|nr:DUF3325 family protein [Azohydromonas aeria]